MRLLMLNNEFPPLGGGTASVNLVLLRLLARKADLEVDLVTASGDSTGKLERFADRIRVVWVPVRVRNPHHARKRELLAYAARALSEALRLHAVKAYDLCMAWSGVPAGRVALSLKRRTGLRYLVRVGGSDIPGHERRYRALYPALTPVIRRIWREAECVIVKCRREREKILRHDRTINLAVIPNGVDTACFSPSRTWTDCGPLRLVIVARLIEHKGHRFLFDALRALVSEGVDVVLDVAGAGDAEHDYRKLASRLGVNDRIRFLGYVPRERIADVYRGGHVFVLPSDDEGMSVSTLEAMASGLPVVVTRTGGTDELVEHGVNGFVFERSDTGALTAFLRRLAQDRDLVRRMGEASRIRAERFQWSDAANRYMDLFASLTGQESRAHKDQASRTAES